MKTVTVTGASGGFWTQQCLRRLCERSEAIHCHEGRVDCFVAPLLAMTSRNTSVKLHNINLTTSMLRLSSKDESRSRYRHGRLTGRRPRARQHADGVDDGKGADPDRACASGRHYAA